jgi:hypothetical protein
MNSIIDKNKLKKFFENKNCEISDKVLIQIRDYLVSKKSPLIEHFDKDYKEEFIKNMKGMGTVLPPNYFGDSESSFAGLSETSPPISSITSNVFPLDNGIGTSMDGFGKMMILISQKEMQEFIKMSKLEKPKNIKRATSFMNGILRRLLMITINESKNKKITKAGFDRAIKTFKNKNFKKIKTLKK